MHNYPSSTFVSGRKLAASSRGVADLRRRRRWRAPPACAAGPAPRLDRALCLRPRHDDLARQQLQRRLGVFAVDRIAEDRPALRSAMDAQLMGSARLRLQFEPGDRSAAPDAASPNPANRPRGSARQIDLHPSSPFVVEAANSEIDRAGLNVGRTGDDHPVDFRDQALLEQETQFLQSLAVPSEHEAADGLAVEPVGEGGLARQAEGQSRIRVRCSDRPSVPGERRRPRACR